jgi:hypothetical protein
VPALAVRDHLPCFSPLPIDQAWASFLELVRTQYGDMQRIQDGVFGERVVVRSVSST